MSELGAPEAPTEAGTGTVACAVCPGPMLPMLCGNGVPASAPTFVLFSMTFAAAVPPVLAMVIWTVTLLPERVSRLVTTRLAGLEDPAGFTVIVVVSVAVVYRIALAGVKVTDSVWPLPGESTVPAGGL